MGRLKIHIPHSQKPKQKTENNILTNSTDFKNGPHENKIFLNHHKIAAILRFFFNIKISLNCLILNFLILF